MAEKSAVMTREGKDMNKVLDSSATLADAIREAYLDLPVAILCARYWYRGMLRVVGSDYIALSNVRAVEVTGPAATAFPQTEDPVPSDMYISLNAVEQICQPFWAWPNMPIKIPKNIEEGIKVAAKEKAERDAQRKREQEEARKAQAARQAQDKVDDGTTTASGE
jgi:hypothetical protein